MTHPFLERLASGVVLSDGAMGTMLYAAGVQLDDCFDELNLSNPQLVASVHRAYLSPLEEAVAYRQLIDEFGLTQASVAERVGRSRVSVTNTLRLLSAPEAVQTALQEGKITEGHARALLGLPNAADQIAMLDLVIGKGWTVRQTEEAVRKWIADPDRAQPERPQNPLVTALEERFQRALGTRVAVRQPPGASSGTVVIHFYSDEQLQALYDRLIGEDLL